MTKVNHDILYSLHTTHMQQKEMFIEEH